MSTPTLSRPATAPPVTTAPIRTPTDPSAPDADPPFLPRVPRLSPARLARIAVRASAWAALWRDDIRFDDIRYSVRLGVGAGFEVWLLTWLPDQTTEPHDHGDSAGAFTVLSGRLEEHGAHVDADGRVVWSRRRLTAGDVRSFGPAYIHDVVNTDAEPAVSLHVYGPALTRMTRYADVDGRLVSRGTELAGVDW